MPRRFVSKIGKREEVIGDGSIYSMPANAHKGYKPRDYSADPIVQGYGALNMPLIDRAEWPERIEAMERNKTRISDIVKRAGFKVHNQASTNYCWAHGSATAYEANVIVQGGQYVRMSPSSVGGPITRFRNVGGWGSNAMRYMREHGIVPADKWPEASINQRYYTAENRELGKRFRPTDYVDLTPRNFDELATCLLSGFAVGVAYNWWRHLVCAFDLVKLSGRDRFGVRIANSWGERWSEGGYGILEGSKMVPDEGNVVRASRPVFYEG